MNNAAWSPNESKVGVDLLEDAYELLSSVARDQRKKETHNLCVEVACRDTICPEKWGKIYFNQCPLGQ